LVSDGLGDEPPDQRTRLYAISSNFDMGLARLKSFFAVLRPLASTQLIARLDESVAFLEAHRDRHLLLETVELDLMTESGEAALRACVDNEIDTCRRIGAAVDALSQNLAEAGTRLLAAARQKSEAPFDVLYGLALDNDFDNVREGKTENPLGLSWWSDVLYFELWNRAQFEANR
jgi:hypothetical protein